MHDEKTKLRRVVRMVVIIVLATVLALGIKLFPTPGETSSEVTIRIVAAAIIWTCLFYTAGSEFFPRWFR